jgi:hypothetical protein
VIILLASWGGMLAQMTDEKYNGFSPIFAVIAGFIIALTSCNLLNIVIGSPYSYISTYHAYGSIIPILIVTFVAIGAFITILLAKEKKIRYGIYTGIIFILSSMLEAYFNPATYAVVIIPKLLVLFL